MNYGTAAFWMILLCWTAVPGFAKELPTQSQNTEIFQKRIADNQNIVVIREMVNSDLLASLLADGRKSSITRAYGIRVELHTESGPPLLLATKLFTETDQHKCGVDVVNVAVGSGAIVIAVTVGSELNLWRIQIGTMSSDSWAPLDGWTVLARATPLDRKSVQVGFSQAPDGRWMVEVVDLRPANKQPFPPTKFEQVGNEWRFEVTKSWNNR